MALKINLAKSAGFCFGVRRALKIAFDVAKTQESIEMLGDIVHNEDVVTNINKAGIRKTTRLGKGKNKALLIRAHGTSRGTLKKARAYGYRIIDATCPMVKEIHRIAHTAERKGYRIIIIGDKKHDEVQGIKGQLKGKPIVIDTIENIPFSTLKRIKKGGVVVQSTQNIDKVLEIVAVLERCVKHLSFSIQSADRRRPSRMRSRNCPARMTQ